MKCEKCGKNIPQVRLDALPDTTFCVKCAERHGARPHAYMVYGHKTAPEIVVVDQKDKEAMRQAERAHRRSR